MVASGLGGGVGALGEYLGEYEVEGAAIEVSWFGGGSGSLAGTLWNYKKS